MRAFMPSVLLLLACLSGIAFAQSPATKPTVSPPGAVGPRADTVELDRAAEAARQGNGYVCRSNDDGKTACICRTSAPADDHLSCNGMMKLCKKMGGSTRPDCSGGICACTFKL